MIRNHLGLAFGLKAAGYWEALMRVSNLYLMLVTTPLAVYYLPTLSQIVNRADLRREICRGERIHLFESPFESVWIC